MPTYSYHCSSCQHELEIFQKITDEPVTLCSNCQMHTLKRGIGGGQATFQFKGKGFYKTDYKRSSSDCCPCGKNAGNCKSSD